MQQHIQQLGKAIASAWHQHSLNPTHVEKYEDLCGDAHMAGTDQWFDRVIPITAAGKR